MTESASGPELNYKIRDYVNRKHDEAKSARG